MATQDVLVQGEIGKTIQWFANANQTNAPINLTGASVTFSWREPNNGPVHEASAPVDPGGASATYTTTGTEFPIAGDYTFQFEAVLPGGNSRKSPLYLQTIIESLV